MLDKNGWQEMKVVASRDDGEYRGHGIMIGTRLRVRPLPDAAANDRLYWEAHTDDVVDLRDQMPSDEKILRFFYNELASV